MKYLINNSNKTISEKILEINHVSRQDLDVSNFSIDKNIKIIDEFISEFLKYKDGKYLIAGDYDCDGICATTIIKKLLDDLNIQNNYYIPSRSKEGYGLNVNTVKNAIENGFDVLVTVDNGVSSIEELKYAKDNGIKTFVLDHHEYTTKPDVDGFLHPNLFENKYSDMCAAGLCALVSNYIREDDYTSVLGGLGTLGDMVSVLNYNRYLLVKMLDLLNSNNIYQINYLAACNKYDYDTLAFNVIPKINAVSRLSEYLNVNMLVKYLLADEKYCLAYVDKINTLNETRKELTKQYVSKASRLIDDKNFIIVKDNDFKEGLCGLIANKLMNDLHKPVIALAYKQDLLVGSGRAPEGFNLFDYLKPCESIMEAYGGHAQAIGLTINASNLEILEKYIENHPFEIGEASKDVISIDAQDVSLNIIDEIDSLKPFGTNFKEPLFYIEGVNPKRKFIIKDKYPKFFVNDNAEAISFNSKHIDKDFYAIVGKLKKDDYKKNKVSILIEDLV